jgi:hypothetical protein
MSYDEDLLDVLRERGIVANDFSWDRSEAVDVVHAGTR